MATQDLAKKKDRTSKKKKKATTEASQQETQATSEVVAATVEQEDNNNGGSDFKKKKKKAKKEVAEVETQATSEVAAAVEKEPQQQEDNNNGRSDFKKKKKKKARKEVAEVETQATSEVAVAVEEEPQQADNNNNNKKDRKSSKKKKKSKKDKWGQPVISEGAEHETELAQVAAVAEEQEQEAEGCYEKNKVVVSGMPYSATEDDIREFFKDAGPVRLLQLSKFPDSGNFSGLAFVTFETAVDAINSLKLDGAQMANRFVKVERCRARVDLQRKRKAEFLSDPKKVDGCFSAYIGNLSWEVTEDDIRACFEASKISSIRFATNKKTGEFRGFGHIDFEDDASLEEAMKKNQVELHGRPIKIAYAVSNRD